ncbi:MAG TPA: response regulator transcription factor, partial [Thermomicrobiales bacterium]|nr:response regulator transcription factor [Thermomicrobiales bacterium]
MISVLLVDDHPVVIEGLRKVLATTGDIEVTGEAHDAAGAIERARSLQPDVILLDLRMPGASGVQATRRLRDIETRSAVIILTSYGDQAYVRQALEAGADGYLLKSTPPEQLIAAIRAAARGRRQLSPELLDGVL